MKLRNLPRVRFAPDEIRGESVSIGGEKLKINDVFLDHLRKMTQRFIAQILVGTAKDPLHPDEARLLLEAIEGGDVGILKEGLKQKLIGALKIMIGRSIGSKVQRSVVTMSSDLKKIETVPEANDAAYQSAVLGCYRDVQARVRILISARNEAWEAHREIAGAERGEVEKARTRLSEAKAREARVKAQPLGGPIEEEVSTTGNVVQTSLDNQILVYLQTTADGRELMRRIDALFSEKVPLGQGEKSGKKVELDEDELHRFIQKYTIISLQKRGFSSITAEHLLTLIHKALGCRSEEGLLYDVDNITHRAIFEVLHQRQPTSSSRESSSWCTIASHCLPPAALSAIGRAYAVLKVDEPLTDANRQAVDLVYHHLNAECVRMGFPYRFQKPSSNLTT